MAARSEREEDADSVPSPSQLEQSVTKVLGMRLAQRVPVFPQAHQQCHGFDAGRFGQVRHEALDWAFAGSCAVVCDGPRTRIV